MAIQDKSTQAKQGKGFGGQSDSKPRSTQPSQGETEANALAVGVGGALSHQASALGVLAQQTDEQITEIAKPIADYFGTVADGTALVSRVAQLMSQGSGGPADLTSVVKVEAPRLPSEKPATMADYFGQPKRISLPGA